jgi:enoyl reductase-like protein
MFLESLDSANQSRRPAQSAIIGVETIAREQETVDFMNEARFDDLLERVESRFFDDIAQIANERCCGRQLKAVQLMIEQKT